MTLFIPLKFGFTPKQAAELKATGIVVDCERPFCPSYDEDRFSTLKKFWDALQPGQVLRFQFMGEAVAYRIKKKTLESHPHPEDLKAAIRKRGTTLAEISERHGFDSSTAYHALHRPIPLANYAIAKALGTTAHKLWPNWFDKNDQRITLRRKKGSAVSRTRQRKKTA